MAFGIKRCDRSELGYPSSHPARVFLFITLGKSMNLTIFPPSMNK